MAILTPGSCFFSSQLPWRRAGTVHALPCATVMSESTMPVANDEGLGFGAAPKADAPAVLPAAAAAAPETRRVRGTRLRGHTADVNCLAVNNRGVHATQLASAGEGVLTSPHPPAPQE